MFDIVLECFELQPDNNVFLNLIPIFPKSNASQILGFKFQYYQRLEVNTTVPFGLYQLTATLVKKEFLDLDSIYAHLLPNDDEAFEHYNVFSAKRLDEANKIGKINLAATGKDLMDDEKQGDVTVDLFAALDMESEAVTERSSELEKSQTLGLLIGFLFVDDWYHANILFRRLLPLNPVEHIRICDGLFRLIEKTISPAYEVVRQPQHQAPEGGSDLMETESDSTNRSFIDLPKELFEMLNCVGPYLHRDTLLLQKVCRVLRGYYLCALKSANSGDGSSNVEGNRTPRLHLKEARLNLEEALGACLLPSLQLIPANPAVGQEIWAVLSLLPYEARYRLYGEWEKDDESSPMVLSAKQTAKLDTRRILKRLAKENLKQLGRMVAKLAHANPMTVLRTIVHQIEAYRDMIAPVVDAFKYLTQLEYDILEYVVIERLVQGGREKLKDDGLNLSDWLQSLASFWGHLCKKYPSMELRGLFQYLVNQLKKGSGIELVLLQELIQQMANVQYTENMTEEQLDAMAGSETLRYQATSFGATRNNKALIKSTNRLRDSLLPKDEPKLAIPLLLLIAQHRAVVVIEADSPHIKMVCEQLDRCHGSLLQYVEFLCGAMSPITSYAQMVPDLHDLIHSYHLEPEVAFLIYRPVMRLFRCQSSTSDVLWPLDCDEITSNPASAGKENEPTDVSGKLILNLGPPRKPIMWSDLLDTVRTVLPSKAWNSLSPDLYATFWGLTLYDLYVPRNRYESEISKQHAALKALEELSDNSNSAITKRKKDKERIQESLDRLTSELQKHEENVASVRRRLAREKDKWLSSCPDTLKINMEFLQRCIFPRCTFSMPDAVYCAMFVNTLHSLGTPFFNTVNHIDVLICKTLQPMICCSTEYEVGRLGRFLFETLKTAYYWKSDESIYERECGNMPGFAVYYRYPNSQRVTYSQFIKVHWKWSQRITRLLIQCLESVEYMEIRNALILLTKVSNVFPVTRKSGINLEKRVAKLKSDEREDLKVLATGVAAALAARKPSWVTEEEFGMGYLDLKPAPVASKSVYVAPVTSTMPPSEGRNAASSGGQHHEPTPRPKPSETNKHENKYDKVKLSNNGSDASMPSGPSTHKQTDESGNRVLEEKTATAKTSLDSEGRSVVKRSVPATSVSKQPKQDLVKNETKPKSLGRPSDRDIHTTDTKPAHEPGPPAKSSRPSEADTSKLAESRNSSVKDEPTEPVDAQKRSSSRPSHSPRTDTVFPSKSTDKPTKRTSPAEEQDRLIKRRKGEHDPRDIEPDRDRHVDPKHHPADFDKVTDRSSKDERYDRDRFDKSHGDDMVEKSRDRSMERYSRERSVDRGKDERSSKQQRYNNDEKSTHAADERFRGASLPPPPPLPPHMVPVNTNRRDEDGDRRFGTTRHSQRLSPKHDDRERRRSEENLLLSQEDAKRRREEEFRDRKRDERDGFSTKIDDREREADREKVNVMKEETDPNASKRRKLKREHLPEAGEYSPVASPAAAPPLNINMAPSSYDMRDRGGDRKPAVLQRPVYLEEPAPTRMHGKDVPAKMTRRDSDPMYDREWEDEKRQRVESKRRHRK